MTAMTPNTPEAPAGKPSSEGSTTTRLVAMHVTENKSIGELALGGLNVVRVFVDGDYEYGYWLREHKIFSMLDAAQQQAYLAGPEAKLEVSRDIAQRIIDMGTTPYAKRQLA